MGLLLDVMHASAILSDFWRHSSTRRASPGAAAGSSAGAVAASSSSPSRRSPSGFGGASVANILPGPTGLTGPTARAFVGSWDADAGVFKLVVAAGEHGGVLRKYREIEVTVRASQGVRLPAGGLPVDSAALTVRVVAQHGNMPEAAAVERSPAVRMGTLEAATLLFAPAVAGAATALTLQFQYNQPVRSGDRLVLLLPGFEARPLLNFFGFSVLLLALSWRVSRITKATLKWLFWVADLN